MPLFHIRVPSALACTVDAIPLLLVKDIVSARFLTQRMKITQTRSAQRDLENELSGPYSALRHSPPYCIQIVQCACIDTLLTVWSFLEMSMKVSAIR